MNPEATLTDRELTCDLLVLGGGPGGYSAAFRGADLGLSTIIVERGATLGGVCLNVGCIPSKALLHVASVNEAAGKLAEHGLMFTGKSVELDKLRAWKDSTVSKLTRGLQSLANGRKVRVVRGSAEFVNDRSLQVTGDQGESKFIRFAHAIIAAGSEALDPFALLGSAEGAALVGADPRIVDSTGALALPTLPKRMLVVGGGVIGLELATVYAALGAEVDIVEKADRLMAGADRDFVRVWTRSNQKRIRRILLGTVVSALKKTPHGLEVGFRGQAQEPAEYDLILVAAGRTPNGNLIGAAAAGVRVSERGFIEVDSQMRTNVPHIFAVGDIVGAPMLAHKATHQGHVAAEVAAGLPAHFDARVIPEVAYTDPEIAWVGVTVEGAKQRGQSVRELLFPWQASGRAVATGRDEGMTKLLIDEATERVVGGGIVGTHAGDLVGELALAIEMGCHPTDLAKTIHPHPTLCESLGLAAAIHASACTELPKASA
ncbi:MAG TPA: dihydrolipoyl dehydrogenase [Polyangiaceae bacterium]|nr:dihydrolipoyl dehydrogenase [Polyangiaceae bacterium]